jgi:hypothetical protein
MDYAISTANIMSDIYRPVPLNKKMVVSLCSSLENLQQYFSTSKLIMKLMIGQDEIGFTDMSMQGLIPTTSKAAFCSVNEDNTVTVESPCFLKGSKTGEVPTSQSGLQPYVHLRIRLKYQEMEWKDTGQSEAQFKGLINKPARLLRSSSYTVLDVPTQSVYKVPNVDVEDNDANSNAHVRGTVMQHDETSGIIKQDTNKNVHISGHRQASGDEVEVGNVAQFLKEIKMPAGQSPLSASAGQLRPLHAQTISTDNHSENILHDSSTQTSGGIDEPYHIYSLDIAVQSVAFQRLPPRKRCYFKYVVHLSHFA